MSPCSTWIENILLSEPRAAEKAFRLWRESFDLDKVEGDCLAILPILSDKIAEWLSREPRTVQERKLLGICRRGWALNQLRYREAIQAVKALRTAGVEPTLIFGAVAWALLYEEKGAVRPIEGIDILVRREHGTSALRALEGLGWSLEPGMPIPEGPVLHNVGGVWLRSRSSSSLRLAWRLMSVPPEMAQAHEVFPSCLDIELQGTHTLVLPTEELLRDALTRERDALVSWRCDALVLLRNRTVDWGLLKRLIRDFPAAQTRLDQLRSEAGATIPPGILDWRQPGRLRRRFSRIWVDYKRVSWARSQTTSLPRFAAYLFQRLSHSMNERTP